jgi:hypothetical protein
LLLFLFFFPPIEYVAVLVVVISTQVENLEEHVIPKLVLLVIPKIGVGADVATLALGSRPRLRGLQGGGPRGRKPGS